MNLKRTTIILFAFFCFTRVWDPCNGQVPLKSRSEVEGYNDIPQEMVFVHFNASFLFAGEYLYYKIYCLDRHTQNLSAISKIAYVELFGEDGTKVFAQKVRLENGEGRGDFFIPVTVPSGNYKLVAYTQWMENGNDTNYFRNDLSILNPYQGNQKAILKDTGSKDSIPTDSLKSPLETKIYASKTNNNLLAMSIIGEKFAKRSKVSLLLTSARDSVAYGTYSISVRKKDNIDVPKKSIATNFKTLYTGQIPTMGKPGDTIFLPELRGELITGKVVQKESGEPVANLNVALSIPGTEYVLKIANTDSNGTYYFNLNEHYSGTHAIIQVLGDDREKYKLLSDENSSELDFSKLKFNSFHITREMRDMIQERSIYNQIENGYFGAKPDTIKSVPGTAPFNLEDAEVYDLDDYVRFPTIRETTIEFLANVYTTKTKNGEEVFQVRQANTYLESVFLPLVVVDGFLVQDQQNIINYNARKIKTIRILRNKYIFGQQIYKGIIAMESIDGNYNLNLYGDYAKNRELFKPLPKKNYFHQTYTDANTSELAHIPDFRYQLLWEPEIKLNSKERTIDFYTSDIPGIYIIEVEGFTKKGQPISQKAEIEVE